jgi:hypothetical protein
MSYPTRKPRMKNDGTRETVLSYNGLEESIRGMTPEEKLPRIKQFLANAADHPEMEVSAETIEQMKAAIGIYERATDNLESPDEVMALWFML